MNKKTYLERFSRLAHWRLPPSEAEEVIADYEELVSAHPEDGTALVKTLGDPLVAVKLLGMTKEYLCWMAIFGLLCVSLIYFCLDMLIEGYCPYGFGHLYDLDKILFYLSIGLLSFWKWKSPKGKSGKCPGLLPALLGMLVPAGVLAAVTVSMCIILLGFLKGELSLPVFWIAHVMRTSLCLAGTVSFIAALTGLVKSRIWNRRWLALVIMAVTVLFLCMQMVLLIRSLDDAEAGLRVIRQYIPVAIIGTAGVIWSLC